MGINEKPESYVYIKGTRFLQAVGLLFGLYFILLTVVLGAGYSFNYFWLTAAIMCLFNKILQMGFKQLPLFLKRTILFILIAGLASFTIVEGFIVQAASDQPQKNADYVVVLGAKVGTRALRFRAEAAVDYAKDNPNTIIVASGGKGRDETVSEAQAIKKMLVNAGVASNRILLEDKSTSTYENLIFSQKYIDPEKKSVVIVSSNFHIFRAEMIAKQAGYKHVSGKSAKIDCWLIPQYFVREYAGVLDKLIRG